MPSRTPRLGIEIAATRIAGGGRSVARTLSALQLRRRRSPDRARSRRPRRPAARPRASAPAARLTVPTTVTSIISGPGDRVRLPPTTCSRCACARAPRTRRRCASKSSQRQRRRQRQREQRQPRRRAHRRQVAQVDRQRAVADGVGRREAPIEVHAFDDRVDGEHLEAVPLGLDHRGIVADADDQPGGRRREARDR